MDGVEPALHDEPQRAVHRGLEVLARGAVPGRVVTAEDAHVQRPAVDDAEGEGRRTVLGVEHLGDHDLAAAPARTAAEAQAAAQIADRALLAQLLAVPRLHLHDERRVPLQVRRIGCHRPGTVAARGEPLQVTAHEGAA